MRSLATRRAHLALSGAVADGVRVLQAANFDLILVETAGIGQSDSEIVDRVDLSVYVMTPEYGAPSQLEKIDMLELADAVVLNKFDRRGGEDALRDVKKQWRRNHPDAAAVARRRGPGLREHRQPLERPGHGPRVRGARRPARGARLRRLRGAGREEPGGCPRRCRSCPPSAPATWPRSPRPCAATARGSRATSRRRAARSAWPRRCARSATRVPEMAHAVRRGGAPRTARRAPRSLALRRPYDAALRALSADARAELARWPETRARYTAEEQSYEVRGRAIGVREPRGHACRGSSSRASRSRAPRSGASSRASRRSRTCPAASRSPRACSRSSAPARKTPRACSRARARPSAPTCASTCSRRRSPRCGSRPRSTA